MSQNDMARALEAIAADDGTRGKVAKGHLGSLEDLGLSFTKEEKSLLHGAAKNFPHDGGYAYAHFVRNFNEGNAGEQQGAVSGTESPEFNAAVRYAATGKLDILNATAE